MARVTIGRSAAGASGQGSAAGAVPSSSGALDPNPPTRGPGQVPGGLAVISAIAILIVAVFNLEIPYFAITPGPAPDVIELIDISGAETQPVTGHLLLTTVSLKEIRVAEAIRGWFDSDYEIVSKSAIIPNGESVRDAERKTSEQMDESQEHAAAAALALLGYEVKITPVGARVIGVQPDSPALKVLHPGDVIVGADATPIHREEELRTVIRRHKVGEWIALKVRRGTSELAVRTKTIGNQDDPTKPVIGVFLQNVPLVKLPLAIDIESLGIGGPSAGLMYALGIVDLLDSSDLAKGRTVAGTGAISLDGTVEPVGGIRQKIAGARHEGAELFIAPLVELREACSRAGDMPIIGVQHLKDAVAALKGAPVPAERRCH